MDEIDAVGRQMLIDRPRLSRGRLSVFRDGHCLDHWFPHLNVSLKRAGTDHVLWQWQSHSEPVDPDEPPPYGEELMLEKYFELDVPLKSPRGLEAVVRLGPGISRSGFVDKFSVTLYLYPGSVEERGVQVGVVDFASGLKASSCPVYFRVNFPW